MPELPDGPDQDQQGAATSHVRFFVLAALCLAAAIAYLQRNAIAVAESTIRTEYRLTKEEMGWALGSFMITYGIFQIPSGWFSDRWGGRRTLAIYAFTWSLAMLALAVPVGLPLGAVSSGLDARPAGSLVFLYWLLGTRMLAGAAQAGIFPAAAIAISRWLPASEKGIAGGWLAAAQQIGAVAATALAALLIAQLDWRLMFAGFAVPGFLFALWYLFWFRDDPSQHAGVTASELRYIHGGGPPPAREQVPMPWISFLLSPATWCICGQQFFRAFGYAFFATWFPTFLQETRHVSVANAGWLAGLPLAATLAGALIGGTVCDWVLHRTGSRFWGRKAFAICGMFAGGLFVFAAFLAHDALSAVLIISAGAFFGALAGPAAYALTIEMAGRHVASVFAVMNMSGVIGAFVSPVVVPYLLKQPGGWNLVLGMFGVIYLLGALCWTLLRPEGTVFDQSWCRPAEEPSSVEGHG